MVGSALSAEKQSDAVLFTAATVYGASAAPSL